MIRRARTRTVNSCARTLAAAVAFDGVHARVGGADDLVHMRAVARRRGQAHAGADLQREAALHSERSFHAARRAFPWSAPTPVRPWFRASGSRIRRRRSGSTDPACGSAPAAGCPTRASSSLPIMCPCASLTSLKRSRSQKRQAQRLLELCRPPQLAAKHS